MGGKTRRNLSVLLLVSFYIGFFPVAANANDGDCGGQIITEGSAELTAEAARVVDEINRTCHNPSACSPEKLASVVKASVEKAPPKYKSAFRALSRLSRRALVLLLWGASILGPGVVSYYLTAGVPDGLRISVTSFVMVMGSVLFGRFSSPIEKRLGPKVETFAFWLWDPNETDGWGQIMKRLPETDRFRYSQIYNQLIVLRSYFEIAGGKLREGDTRGAARQYLNAVLLSHEMFAGLNLEHPSTLREVRSYLPEHSKISPQLKEDVAREAAAMLLEMPAEELYQAVIDHRAEVADFTKSILRTWLDASS